MLFNYDYKRQHYRNTPIIGVWIYKEKNLYTKHFGTDQEGFDLSYNAVSGEFNYPDGVEADRNTTSDEHQAESYVGFLCIAQLFERGYLPKHIKLEGRNYAGNDLGWCDILVKDNDGIEYLIIECKTADVSKKDDEFRKHWAKTLRNGDQLFRYFNTYRRAKYLCLLSADYPEYTKEGHTEHKYENIYHIISLVDNEEYLRTDNKLKSFQQLRDGQGSSDDFFDVWKQTYKQDFNTRGLLEEGIAAFNIGNKSYNLGDLKTVDEYSLERKYNEFAVILRKHTISSHENAFDKLINLFISKIIDEKYNAKELTLLWKGAAYDDYFSLQDRLNILYRQGMKEFFGDEVTYVENQQIDDAFAFLTSKADEGKETIKRYFRQLKYFNNNPFAFLDVHNEDLFFQNAVILKDVISMLQGIYLTSNKDNQFLGDLFEGFLNKGVHQSEGQFFTPIPIVRFLVSSLPLRQLLEESGSIPRAIDYACGSGHFLTEYARQIQPIVAELKNTDIKNYYEQIVGIEKDYRLSKVSQVAAFMYGMDGIHIHYSDALVDVPDIKDHTFKVLIANPPYAVSGFLETLSEEQRQRFTLSQYVSNTEKNKTIETFFIERAAQLLDKGGVATIILPSSILTKGGLYMRTRELLLKNFDIVSICCFGPNTFGQTNTSTVALFLRRKAIEPDVANHIQNRIDAWFDGNMDDDEFYNDDSLLDDYVKRIGVSREDYVAMMQGQLTDTFLNTEIVQEYVNALNIHKQGKNPASTALATKAKEVRDNAQNFVKSKIFKQKAIEAQDEDIRRFTLQFIREIEKEKLYYYMLATTNPQPVLVMKAPENKGKKDRKEQRFLGYEWSNRKGAEGIHYLNTGAEKKPSDEEEVDDDTINQIKSINGIITPLFNPLNLDDESKINVLIRENYNQEDVEVGESADGKVELYSLIDLLDFSHVDFDKVIKTKAILSYPKFETKYSTEKLGKIAPYIKTKIALTDIEATTYVTTENMLQNRGGVFPFEGAPNIDKVTEYKKGDILISNIRPYLKKIWKADVDGGCSNDVLVFRNTRKDIVLDDYLNIVLSSDIFFDYMMVGKTGLKMPRGDKKVIPGFMIPKPPMKIQQKIVAECNKVEKEYQKANARIAEIQTQIDTLFQQAQSQASISVRLNREDIFNIQIGQRVLKTEIVDDGEYCVYSANVFEPFGRIKQSILSDFSKPSVIWGIDGNWQVNYIEKSILFNPTDHCGVIRVLDETVVLPRYLVYPLLKAGEMERFSRSNRASTERIRALSFMIPPINIQQQIVNQVLPLEQEANNLRQIIGACSEKKQAILDKYLK